MTGQHGHTNGDSTQTSKVDTGDFPFPLTDGSKESPYLTWLRNNSNYMAPRGFIDNLRSVGVLVRGIVVNFLIFLPYLLLVSIALGYSHHWMLNNPYGVTSGILVVAVFWILLFALAGPLFKIFSYKRSRETGSESSITARDRYERSFGAVLLSILAMGLVESLPWMVELLHDLRQQERFGFGWQGGLTAVASVLALLSGADKLLSMLGGVKKQLAMVLIGILGLFAPLVVILYATDFLVYGLPPDEWVMLSPLVVPVAGLIGLVIAVPLGWWQRAFSGKELAAVLGMIVVGSLVVVAAVSGIDVAITQGSESRYKALRETDPIDATFAHFEKVSREPGADLETAALVDDIVLAEKKISSVQKETPRSQKEFEATIARYFEAALPLAWLGYELSWRPEDQLQPLRRGIARFAEGQLLEAIGDSGDGSVAQHLVHALLLRPIQDQSRLASNEAAQAQTPAPPGSDGPALVRTRFRELDQALIFREASNMARAALSRSRSPVDEIAPLVSEQTLFDSVAKKFAASPGKAELARLAGQQEMARLLTKAEILDLVIPPEPVSPELQATFRDWFVEHSLLPPQVDQPSASLSSPGGVEPTPEETQAAREAMKARARALAQLAEPAVTTSAPDVEQDPTTEEIAEAARRQLATLALQDLSVNGLAAVASVADRDTLEAYAKVTGQRVLPPLNSDLPDDRDRLKDFHAFAKLGLKELVELSSFESPPSADSYGWFDAETSELDGNAPLRRVNQFSDEHRYTLLIAAKALGVPDDSDVCTNFDWADPQEPAFPRSCNELEKLARRQMIALIVDPQNWYFEDRGRDRALDYLSVVSGSPSLVRDYEALAAIAVSKFHAPIGVSTDDLMAKVMLGPHGGLEVRRLRSVKEELTKAVMPPKAIFVALLAFGLWLGLWVTVDVNLTSIHGLYRDRLASAFLVGRDTKGNIGIEEDLDLDEMCRHEARSTAPYHLINTAINLQGSKDVSIRDRNSDFFIFSKRFVGGARTGYCRSETMEQVYPQMSVASAMAISAAAASPNMGRQSSPLLAAFMTLLNIRLGYWVPNPGLLEENDVRPFWKRLWRAPQLATTTPGYTFQEVFKAELDEIERRWEQAYPEGEQRQRNLNERLAAVIGDGGLAPTISHQLAGVGFSGGGIRSAALNLGIAQALHQRGVFDHLDYMSTVSGGGYLGSSISTVMRARERLVSGVAGTVSIETEKLVSEIAGTVTITPEQAGQDDDKTATVTHAATGESRKYRYSARAELAVASEQEVRAGQLLLKYRDVWVTPSDSREKPQRYRFSGHATLNVTDRENIKVGTPLLMPRHARDESQIAGTVSVENLTNTVRVQGPQAETPQEYRFSRLDRIIVKTGDEVKRNQALILRSDTLGQRFRWRVRPAAFLREMLGRLDETHRWVNLSDGGHIENLAAIELLRRRCKYIILGDGEADPNLHFAGLATLMRSAFIDLGIRIDMDLDEIRLTKAGQDGEADVSKRHWAFGLITYPSDQENGLGQEEGFLLYLKSSFTGDEGEATREYRHRFPSFPHESTGDQFFDEAQFEAYRALGQHIAEGVLPAKQGESSGKKMSFAELEGWFADLRQTANRRQAKPAGLSGAESPDPV